jgi:hypothetical protein
LPREGKYATFATQRKYVKEIPRESIFKCTQVRMMDLKKKVIILTIAILIWDGVIVGDIFAPPMTPAMPVFISTWNTGEPGRSGINQIALPLTSYGTYNFSVSWGDGESNIITLWNSTNSTHTHKPSVLTLL